MIDGYELDELREKASMAEKEIPLLKSRVAYLEARCDLADEQIDGLKCCGNCQHCIFQIYSNNTSPSQYCFNGTSSAYGLPVSRAHSCGKWEKVK